MQQLFVLFVLALCLSVASAFRANGVGLRQRGVVRRYAIDPTDVSPDAEPDAMDDPKLFDMNKRVRLGRSRDQDGKSNIWSIEPRMEVEGDEEAGDSGSKKNLFIVGAVIGAAIVSLPLFQAFSTLLPDPTQY